MTRQRTLLAGTLGIVGFLLSAFGGFKGYSAPPLNPLSDGDSRLILGIAQFSALIILLMITVFAAGGGTQKYRRTWTISSIVLAGIFFGCSLAYYGYREKVSFRFPDVDGAQLYHVGAHYSDAAADFMRRNPGLSPQQLIDEFGGFDNIGAVWPKDGVETVHWRASALYLAMIVGLSATVFALIELAIGLLPPSRSAANPAAGVDIE